MEKTCLKLNIRKTKITASGPVTSWQIVEKVEEVTDFLFLDSKITVEGDCSHKIRRRLLLSRKAMTNLDSVLKSKDITAGKGPCSQGYGLPSSHVWMRELDNKEGIALKNWCFRTVVLEKTFEIPFESREIKPMNLKGKQPWILFGRTDAEAEASTLWSLDANSWLIEKDPDAGKDGREEVKRATGDEMVRWHHRFNGLEFG